MHIIEKMFSSKTDLKLDSTLKLEGVTKYGNFLGWVFKLIGVASKVEVAGISYYVNNKSLLRVIMEVALDSLQVTQTKTFQGFLDKIIIENKTFKSNRKLQDIFNKCCPSAAVPDVIVPVLLSDEDLFQKMRAEIPPMMTTWSKKTLITDQLEAHDKAKTYLQDNLSKCGSSVTFVSPPQNSSNPTSATNLDSSVFSFEYTKDVKEDIERDGNDRDNVFMYVAASQFNGSEQVSSNTNPPGNAHQAYKSDMTQGPRAQLAFSRRQLEIINAGANIGFNGIVKTFKDDSDLKALVVNGYLSPVENEDAQKIADNLKNNSNDIEYLCVTGKPKDALNNVHLFLAAAPAFGQYMGGVQGAGHEALQKQCALNNFRAQFAHAITLKATSDNKPIVVKAAAVGLGAFGNNSFIVAQAFREAALEFGAELKNNNVKVRFQIRMEGNYSSEYPNVLATQVATRLNLTQFNPNAVPTTPIAATVIAAPKPVIPENKTTLFDLKSKDLVRLRDNLKSLTDVEEVAVAQQQMMIKFQHNNKDFNVYLNPQNSNIIIFQSAAASGAGHTRGLHSSQNEKLGIEIDDVGNIVSLNWNNQDIQDKVTFENAQPEAILGIASAITSIQEQVLANKPVSQLSTHLMSALIKNLAVSIPTNPKTIISGEYTLWKVQAQDSQRLPISSTHVINIQKTAEYQRGSQNEKVGIQVEPDGKVVHIIKNNDFANPKKVIDSKITPILEDVAFKVCGEYTTAADRINIKIDRFLLKDGFDQNLNKLGEQLTLASNSHQPPSLFVEFKGESGMDAGGLRREYVSLLFAGMFKGGASSLKMIPREEGGSACRPGTAASYDKQNTELRYPQLSTQENKTFNNLGKAMMLCLRGSAHARVLTGKYFDESLFAAVKVLTCADLKEEFLSREAKIKLAVVLASTDTGCMHLNRIRLELERPAYSIQDNDIEILKATAEVIFEDDDFEWLLDKSRLNYNTQLKTLIEDLLIKKYCRELPPLQAIAQGMHSISGQNEQTRDIYWDTEVMGKTAKEISLSIQGTTDRQAVLKNIPRVNPNGPHSLTKEQGYLNALHDWIMNTATTEDEVEKFINFVTGSTAVISGCEPKINFFPSENAVFSSAHTCFARVDINSDITCTDDEFLTQLKGAINDNGGFNAA